MMRWKIVRTVLLTDIYGRTVGNKIEEVGPEEGFKEQKNALKYVLDNELYVLGVYPEKKIIFVGTEIRRGDIDE